MFSQRNVGPASSGNFSSQSRLQNALTRPLYYRCEELEVALRDASDKEIATFLPLLLENMFGYNGHMGWEMGLQRMYASEVRTMRIFLAPGGPLLRTIYRLAADSTLKFEFPMSYLNSDTRQLLEEGGLLSGFYSDKVQFLPTGQIGRSLHLNAFEYYLFMFTYFMLAPSSRKGYNWYDTREYLYPTLVEDYLEFYLPLAHGPPHLFSSPGHMAPGWQQSTPRFSPPHKQGQHRGYGKQGSSPGTATPTMLSMSALLRSHPSSTSQAFMSFSVSSNDTMEMETSHAATFLQILLEMWVTPNLTSGGFPRSPGVSSQLDASFSGNYLQNVTFYDSCLPSVDQIRLIRIMVKHLHFLTSSAAPATTYTQLQHTSTSYWDEFKRNMVQLYAKKKLYVQLKHCFQHWPLDHNFRIVMETWLSYIQPWRYTDYKCRDMKEANVYRTIDINRWLPFVTDNLLFYTVLLQRMLHRCLRMDLGTLRNAYMVFRWSKVYNAPNLTNIIKEAEHRLYEPSASPRRASENLGLTSPSRHHHHHHHHHHLKSSPSVSPSVNSSHGVISVQFNELESPMFQYQRLFSDPGLHTVADLVKQLVTARGNNANQTQANESDGSFLAWIGMTAADYNVYPNYHRCESDDYHGMPEKRLDGMLEQAINNICQGFEFKVPSFGMVASVSSSAEDLVPETIDTSQGVALSPRGRYQIMTGQRRFEIVMQCDPELQPVRSFENEALVRMCTDVSAYFNDKYGPLFERLCCRHDVLGRIACHFLYQPLLPATTMKRVPPQTAKLYASYGAKPRLKLRWLASYRTFGYLIAAYVAAYLLGLSPLGYIMMLLLLFLLYAFYVGFFMRRTTPLKDTDEMRLKDD